MRSCYLSLTVIIGFSFITVGKAKGQTALVDGKVIRIGSYNLENLWDGNPDNTPRTWEKFRESLPARERSRYPSYLQYFDYSEKTSNWHHPEVLQAKVHNAIEVIQLMQEPEILALQEIESAGNTSEVFDLPYSETESFRDKLQELGYNYFLIGDQEHDNPVAITTAVISKIPIDHLPSLKIRFTDGTSSRDIQAVEAKIGDGRLVLFNSHWKSKRGGNEAIRVLTAKALKARIAAERKAFAHTDIIAVGDLNAAYYETPLTALGCTGDEVKMLGESTSHLYNLWYELEYEERWEHSFDGTRNTLSHMIISDSLYDHIGLQYLDQSFIAVGQQGEAAKKLLNASGNPHRWQTRRVGNKVYHLGKGYSDHLPLVASFRVIVSPPANTNPPDKIDLPSPRKDDKGDELNMVLLDHVDVCKAEDALDLQELDPSDLDSYRGRCVFLDLPEDEAALPLQSRGSFTDSYIDVPLFNIHKDGLDRLSLSLTMTRSYDWRPNVDDSRVSLAEASILPGEYHARNWHPHSNKCFQRKVLQGKGGSVRKVLGRLDYSNGYMSIHIASREDKDLRLEDLPANKTAHCRW